jgi:hypothetical protein
MSSPFGHRRPRRSSGAERIFDDEAGRLWSAGPTMTRHGTEALLFTCLSDPREAPRAVTPPPAFTLTEATPETLRELLARAPKLGRL